MYVCACVYCQLSFENSQYIKKVKHYSSGKTGEDATPTGAKLNYVMHINKKKLGIVLYCILAPCTSSNHAILSCFCMDWAYRADRNQ